MQRTPEPELMDAPAQARAYAEADFSEPNQLFVDRFLGSFDLPGAGRLIDLGCGPGDICIRLASALPGWVVTGLDAGPNMLALAAEALAASGLQSRVDLVLAHLPAEAPQGPFDAIVSNSLLHHLPDPATLWQTINSLAAADCYVQVMDLHRPDSREQAQAMVDEHAADAPEVLRQDFFNSLLAAYTGTEVHEQLAQAGLSDLELTCPSDRHWMVSGRLRR
ncbi:MAG: class I SAM-dependent methyltransferase [Wenzhouxiangella sp.]|nr:MAG: class I SAM-dependent methyltransferase [Wenzhouxiangella sp.]